ncbi:hypothetical protein WDV93_13780 [Pantoea ananatis]
MLYAVGIAPAKLPRIAAALRCSGKQVHVLLDSMAQAQAISDYALQHQVTFFRFH